MRRPLQRSRPAAAVLLVAIASLTLAGNSSGTPTDAAASAGCVRTKHKAKVSAPRFVRRIATGETGWFASPGLVDLDGDGKLEIVAASYSTFVFDAKGRPLGKGTATKGRVYAPEVVADLDGDKQPEIVVGGNEGTVAAYNLVGGPAGAQARMARVDLQRRAVSRGAWHGGRPTSTATASLEVVVTTTNTSPTGSQVFVFDAAGALYRPAGGAGVRSRGRGSTRSRAPATTPTSTASATTGTAPTARTSASATSTTTRSWRSSSPSTTTRSTCSTTTAPRSSPRRGSPTATTRTWVRAWAGGSSSAG